MSEQLAEALRKIVEIGTRDVSERIGDPYTEAGWNDYTIVSPEAEIARDALAAYDARAGEAEIDYAAVVRDDLREAISRIPDSFPSHGDWDLTLPAGHWRKLAAMIAASPAKGGE